MERFEGSKVGPTSFATWDNGVIIATGNKLASASFGGDTSSEVMIVILSSCNVVMLILSCCILELLKSGSLARFKLSNRTWSGLGIRSHSSTHITM